MKISCAESVVELENERGLLIEGVAVTCSRCGHEEESFRTSARSTNRSLVLLRENCPRGESNFYEVS